MKLTATLQNYFSTSYQFITEMNFVQTVEDIFKSFKDNTYIKRFGKNKIAYYEIYDCEDYEIL